MDATHGNAAAAQMLAKAAMEEAAAALSVRRVSTMEDLRTVAPVVDDGHGHTLDPRMVCASANFLTLVLVTGWFCRWDWELAAATACFFAALMLSARAAARISA